MCSVGTAAETTNPNYPYRLPTMTTARKIFDDVSYGAKETATRKGFTLTATLEYDDSGDMPWERDDTHGPVTEWTTRAKHPGEKVLCEDRSSRRYYDFAAAVKIARNEWGCANPADAAEQDFETLRRFCANDWSYMGVVVTASKNGVKLANVSLWGIESDATDYLIEVANDLAEEAITEARKTLATLCKGGN